MMLVVMALWLSGCSPDVQPPLRLGTNVWLGYEPLYLARHEGFIDEDLVSLAEYANSSDVLRGLRSGVLDAGALTLDEVINLHSEEATHDYVIFHVVDISHGADAVVARQPIASLQELPGRRLGFELTALGSYFFQRAVDYAGINPTDIQLVNIEIDDQIAAWRRGDVDALVTFDPVRSELLAMGGVEIFTSKDIPGEIVDVLVIRRDLLQRRGAVAAHIISGWFQAVELLQRDPAYAYPIMDQRLKLGSAGIEAAYRGIRIPDRDEVRTLITGLAPGLKKSAEVMQRTMLQSKLLNQSIDLSRLFSVKLPGLAGD